MNHILNIPWRYTLSEYSGNYFLSVLCGTSAMYTVDIKLHKQEAVDYEKYGIDFIDRLAKDIQSYPTKYLARIEKPNT